MPQVSPSVSWGVLRESVWWRLETWQKEPFPKSTITPITITPLQSDSAVSFSVQSWCISVLTLPVLSWFQCRRVNKHKWHILNSCVNISSSSLFVFCHHILFTCMYYFLRVWSFWPVLSPEPTVVHYLPLGLYTPWTPRLCCWLEGYHHTLVDDFFYRKCYMSICKYFWTWGSPPVLHAVVLE